MPKLSTDRRFFCLPFHFDIAHSVTQLALPLKPALFFLSGAHFEVWDGGDLYEGLFSLVEPRSVKVGGA